MERPEGKYAWTVTVGTKGQIVIPKEAREVFDIHPGDTLILLGDAKQGIAIPPKSTFADYFRHIFGGMTGSETASDDKTSQRDETTRKKKGGRAK